MIRITVELISAVSDDRSRLLGMAEISNEGPIGPGSRICKYNVRLSKTLPGREDEVWKRGTPLMVFDEANIDRFDSVHRGVWDLLYLALKAIIGTRNP